MKEYVTLAERLAKGESKEDLLKELEKQIDTITAELKEKNTKEKNQKEVTQRLISDIIDYGVAYGIINSAKEINSEDYTYIENLLDDIGKDFESYLSLLIEFNAKRYFI